MTEVLLSIRPRAVMAPKASGAAPTPLGLGVARLQRQRSGSDLEPGAQVDPQPAGRVGKQLEADGRCVGIGTQYLGAVGHDRHVRRVDHGDTPAIEHAGPDRCYGVPIGDHRQRRDFGGDLRRLAGHVNR
jgi:hypothetical protein